ncbi:MAG: hypothetical protein IJJ26_05635 [Victivallales bacterium]|nr:hypothetical protein [Victivallales bacterium]
MDFWIGILMVMTVGVTWLVVGFVLGRGPKHGILSPVFLFINIIGCALVALPFAVCGNPFPAWSEPGVCAAVWCFIGSGVFNALQLVFMSKAMENGPNGVIWSIIQSGFVFPLIFGIVFMGSKCTAWTLAGVALMLVSLFVIGIGKDTQTGKTGGGNWKWYCFSSFLVTGVSQLFSTFPFYQKGGCRIPNPWISLICYFGYGAILLIVLLVTHRASLFRVFREHFGKRIFWCYEFLLVFASYPVGILLLYPGMTRLAQAGQGAISYPVAVMSSIAAFEIYAVAVLRERRSAAQLAALALGLCGIFLVCF